MDNWNPLEDAREIIAAFEESTAAISLPPKVIHHSKWLYDFSKDICGNADLAPQPHQEMCEFPELLLGDCKFGGKQQKFGMVLVPRNTFKTTNLVEALTPAILTFNPNARILVTSHKQPQATSRITASRRIIERSEAFHRKYGDDWQPDYREETWSDRAWTVARRTKIGLREASVTAASVGADLTGSHFDVILADDLVTLENCYTQEQREKVYEYLTSLYSYLEPGGVLIVVGTRWHPDDAYGRIIKVDAARKERGEEQRYQYLIRSCYDGPSGLYFPDRCGHEFLQSMRHDIGPRRFAANYENKPIADIDKTFKKEHLQLREFDYFHDKKGGYVRHDNQLIPVVTSMVWDTAGSKATSKSDYHGLAIRGFDEHGRWWMCEALGFKGTPSEVISRVASLIAYYHPMKIYIEAVGSYELWVNDLQRALDKIGVSVQFVVLTHGGVPKAERIELLEPTWSNHRIILKPDQTMAIQQFDDFSVTSLPTYDDVIDAIAGFLKDEDTPESGIQYLEHPNPIDPEWVKREERLEKDRGESSILQRILGRRRRRF